jgi:glycerate 2-kinase
LMEASVNGVSLEDLRQTNQLLLASGWDISAMNAIRVRLSRIKGGGLAREFQPATVVALVLSDVLGNELRTIGSGPLVAQLPLTTTAKHNIEWLSFPANVKSALNRTSDETALDVPVEHFVIGSVSLAIHAAAGAAKKLGLNSLPYADPLKGEARLMARKICRHAASHSRENYCMIFGGETNVKIKGKGLGGRCQEMALSAAQAISKMNDICFLAGSTDGTDGPTNAAGGLVDPDSVARGRTAGVSDAKALSENDSYHYLKSCGGLLVTGPTGSNVNDLVLIVHAS